MNRELRLGGAVAIWALLVRVLNGLRVGAWSAPDGFGFELGAIASRLARGEGFVSPFIEAAQPTAWLGPAAPFFWSLVFRSQGAFTADSYRILLVSQWLASALGAGLLGCLIVRIGTGAGIRRSLCVTFAFLAAASPVVVLQSHHLWTEGYQEVLLALFLLLAYRFQKFPTLGRAVVLGLVAGLGALVNAIVLPVHAAFAVWALLKTRGASRKKLLQCLMVTALVGSAMLTPWMIRNYLVFDAFVPLRSNFGVELRQGNWEGRSVGPHRKLPHPALNPQERDRYAKMGELEYSRYSLGEAKRFMAENPALTVQRILTRVRVFWLGDVTLQHGWIQRGDELYVDQAGPLWRSIMKTGVNLMPFLLLLLPSVRTSIRKTSDLGLFWPVVVLVPLPFYLTIVRDGYSFHSRHYLMVIVGLGLLVVMKPSESLD